MFCRWLLCAVLSLLYPSVALSQSLEHLYKETINRVVEIQMLDSDGATLSQGSGFFISDDRIATNFHVINYGTEAKVVLNGGVSVGVSGVIAFNPDKDLAVLELKRPLAGRGIELSNALPNPGARIAVFGSPRGFAATMSEGIVSAIRNDETHGYVIQMTAPISHGNSGGPVLAMDGRVVGVATFKRLDGESLNFAIPALEIPKLFYHSVPTPLDVFNRDRNKDPDAAKTHFDDFRRYERVKHDVPPGAIDRLRGRDKVDLAEAARYSMILPNGDIIGLYRFFRMKELRGIGQRITAVERNIEALGGRDGRTSFTRGDGSRTHISVESLPPVVDLPPGASDATRGILVDLPLIGEDISIVPQKALEGLMLCSVGKIPILIRTGPEAHVPDGGIFGDRIYFPVGQYESDGEVIGVYDAYDPSEHRPTLDEMAFHAERGGAAVRLYDFHAVHDTGRSSKVRGSGVTRTRVSRDTITGVTYRWNSREPDLKYFEPDSIHDANRHTSGRENAETDVPDHEIEITHELHLKDGRVLRGRVVQQSRSEIVFVLVVGSIEHEMRLRPSEVSELRTLP